MSRGARPNAEGEWPAYLPEGGRDAPRGPCRPSCCKTPLGHSALVAGCACHPPDSTLLAATHQDPNPKDLA